MCVRVCTRTRNNAALVAPQNFYQHGGFFFLSLCYNEDGNNRDSLFGLGSLKVHDVWNEGLGEGIGLGGWDEL